jgi:hypothetical protein
MSVKRCLCMLLCLSALMYPLTSSAYYVIRLKNGRQVITPTYWKHDHTLLFDIYGGIAGVEEGLVSKISEIDASNGIEISAEEQVKDVEVSKTDVQQNDALSLNIEEYRKKRDVVKQQIDSTVEKYREASSKHDNDEKEKIRQEITALSKKYFDITDTVKQKNRGRLPEGWK